MFSIISSRSLSLPHCLSVSLGGTAPAGLCEVASILGSFYALNSAMKIQTISQKALNTGAQCDGYRCESDGPHCVHKEKKTFRFIFLSIRAGTSPITVDGWWGWTNKKIIPENLYICNIVIIQIRGQNGVRIFREFAMHIIRVYQATHRAHTQTYTQITDRNPLGWRCLARHRCDGRNIDFLYWKWLIIVWWRQRQQTWPTMTFEFVSTFVSTFSWRANSKLSCYWMAEVNIPSFICKPFDVERGDEKWKC